MGKVEEMSDEKINNASSLPSIVTEPFSPQTPELPPKLTSAKKSSVEEIAADLKKTPFFMTSLPDDSSVDDNVELAAMQALQYEGTRAEIASGFKESGNEMAKTKKWADGKEFYTKALVALKVERKESEADETEREHNIEIACLVNRALCNLELSTTPSYKNVFWINLTINHRELSLLYA